MTKQRIKVSSDSWSTNKDLYLKLDNRFHFDNFDPCPFENDIEQFDGLAAKWDVDRIFINPPYSAKLKEDFIRRAHRESEQYGKLIVLLVPASTSTKIFHDLIVPNARVELLAARVPFEGIDSDGNWVNPGVGLHTPGSVSDSTPTLKRGGQFDSMIVVFGDPHLGGIGTFDWR